MLDVRPAPADTRSRPTRVFARPPASVTPPADSRRIDLDSLPGPTNDAERSNERRAGPRYAARPLPWSITMSDDPDRRWHRRAAGLAATGDSARGRRGVRHPRGDRLRSNTLQPRPEGRARPAPAATRRSPSDLRPGDRDDRDHLDGRRLTDQARNAPIQNKVSRIMLAVAITTTPRPTNTIAFGPSLSPVLTFEEMGRIANFIASRRS